MNIFKAFQADTTANEVLAKQALFMAKHKSLAIDLEICIKTLSITEEFNLTVDDPMSTSNLVKRIADLKAEITKLIS